MGGANGRSAAASAEAGFKPGLGPVSHLQRSRTCVRVWWRRADPATRSPARVSSSVSVCPLSSFNTSTSVTDYPFLRFEVKYERVVCAKCVFTAIFFFSFLTSCSSAFVAILYKSVF